MSMAAHEPGRKDPPMGAGEAAGTGEMGGGAGAG
jgi:hypothetical protein